MNGTCRSGLSWKLHVAASRKQDRRCQYYLHPEAVLDANLSKRRNPLRFKWVCRSGFQQLSISA